MYFFSLNSEIERDWQNKIVLFCHSLRLQNWEKKFGVGGKNLG